MLFVTSTNEIIGCGHPPISVNYNRVCNNQSCSVKEYRHYSSSVKWESTKYDLSIYELGGIILVSMNMCIYSVYVW